MRRIIAALALAIGVVSCLQHERPGAASNVDSSGVTATPQRPLPPAMLVRLEQNRVLDTAFTADVFGNGVPMTFVASVDTAKHHPGGACFDRLQSFFWNDRDSTWHEAMSDTFACAIDLLVRDITGDGHPEVVVRSMSDFGDSITSVGCVVYSAHDSVWKQLFVTQMGNPTLEDVDHNGTFEILQHDAFTGVMPIVDAIEYVAEIYTFDGAEFIPARTRMPKYFEEGVTKAKNEYARVKTQTPVSSPISDEYDFTLYRPVAAVLIEYQAGGNIAGAREFLKQEKDFLQRMLPPGQMIDLESFVGGK